ncbi:glycosyltransferase family 4 protein [Psychrobacter submarinus]|uniref:glycosyltransferase family 4 protein n=1 Tax=Psychrobacter submarinus TaxID=154108 RepID=UPI001919A90C|nr:glycosyltransferase family 4 protein [Psychrobacter submarinus]
MTTIKKFLIFSNCLHNVFNFRGKLLESIAQLGYEIHIVAPVLKKYATDHSDFISRGYHVHQINMQRTGTNPVKDIKTFIHIYQILTRVKPEYVLSYTVKPMVYGTLAAWLARVSYRFVLFSGLGYTFQQVEETNKRSVFQTCVHMLYQQALARSSKIFFQNSDDLNLLKKLNVFKPIIPTVVVNGSGVDLSDFKVMPLPKDESGNVKLSFLLIARLLKDKGIVEYVEAAKQIKKEYPDAEFHLVGSMDENPAAIEKAQLDQWIAEGDIIYWGELKDVRPAIAASSVYVLPSYREGTSRSVLEAMSMGRAIITTDAPGCRETVVSGKNGYLVPVQAINELTDAMRQFIEHPNLCEQMGLASRNIAVDMYDVKKVNTQMIAEMGLG